MIKKTGMLLTMIFMIVFLSACKSDDNDYDEIIDQVFEEVQKFNDDEDYLYIHGGREESNTYVYVLEGNEEEGLIIRVYYPYEAKRTGEKKYDENWYWLNLRTKGIYLIDPIDITFNSLSEVFVENFNN